MDNSMHDVLYGAIIAARQNLCSIQGEQLHLSVDNNTYTYQRFHCF